MKNIPLNILASGNIVVKQWNPSTGDIDNPIPDAAYPVSNLLDLHPKNISKATEHTAVYELDIFEGCNSIAIFNCPSAEIRVAVYDELGVEYPDYGRTYNMSGISTYQALTSDVTNYQTAVYHEYPYLYVPHTIKVFITALGVENVSCGIMFAGITAIHSNPVYGLTQTFKDYSVVSELNSGATYILKRSIVRIFNFKLDVASCSGEPKIIKDMFLSIGPDPIPWIVVSDMNDEMWLVFARKNTEPSGNFYAYDRVGIPITLIEVL